MFFVRGQSANFILILRAVNRISEICLALPMPTAFSPESKQIRRNVFRAGAGRVKISRKARELHASAGKSSTENVASSLWLELIGAQHRHYNPNRDTADAPS
jgi:hypothetical protein